MALYYPPSVNGVQKTLDAQLDSGTTDSMTLNNVTNVQDAAGVVVINRIDSDGNEKTASLREYISYTGTSGSTLTGLTRNADGGTSDQDHAVGSIVEFIPDVVWAQAIIDNLDGTSTDVELNSPKIKTEINDTNGNELVTITATASAENHINIANAADGGNPAISAVGDDTNVSLELTPKGTGRVTSGTVNIPTISSTDTFTNKRITKRVTTITSSATPTINTDNCDVVTITALATAITSMTTNLSGTPTNFQTLVFRILDDGTARAITWGASFQAMGVALPTTTVVSKVLTVGFIYDSVDEKWGCVASVNES